MKLIAELFSTQDDFTQKKIATIIYDKEKNTVYTPKGDEWILRPGGELTEGGVVGADQNRYYPKDGEKFLRALPVQYSGTYTRASLREEK
jgi:hypothetical protein